MMARKVGWMVAAVAGGALLVGCQRAADEKTLALERRVEQLEKQQASPEPSASPEIVDVSPGAEQGYAPTPQAGAGLAGTAPRATSPRSAPPPRPAPRTAPRSTAGNRPTGAAGTGATTAREPVERIGEAEARKADDLDRETGDPGPRRETATSDAGQLTIPAGTQLELRLETPLSSSTSRAGDRVVARVERATGEDGSIVLPGGTVLQGRVTEAASSGRVKGRARVTVDFDRIVVRGRSHPLQATSISAMAPDTHGRDAKVVGGSAVAGAIIGGLKGGRSGAAKGAVIGAGAGTGAVLITKGKEVELPAGSRWVVRVQNAVRM